MKWILSMLIFISLSAKAQDDSAKYVWYKTQYGMHMPRMWADSIMKIPYRDTIGITPNRGSLLLRPQDGLVYRANGISWAAVGSSSGGTWGSITGTLSAQTDLQSALDAKVPSSRTLTINGSTQDLSANRSWSVGTVTNIATGYGLSGGPITSTGTLLWDSATAALTFLRRKDSVLYTSVSRLTDTAAAIRAAIGSGGSTSIVTSDLSQLPEYKVTVPGIGISASGTTVTNYGVTSLDQKPLYFTASSPYVGTKKGGILWSNTIGDSVKINAPFGIAMGSSFVESHPWSHSRVHPSGAATFNPAVVNIPGQFTYIMTQQLGYLCYNLGIGGQTSTAALLRYERDVRGGTIFNFDGRTANTHSPAMPVYFIFDGCGNDPQSIPSINAARSIENIKMMAQMCQEDGVLFIICNSPVTPSVGDAAGRYLDSVNRFLANGGLKPYGAVVFDLNTMWSNPAYGNDGVNGNAMLLDSSDHTHFNRTYGNDTFATRVIRESKIPKLTKIAFINKLDPVNPITNYNYPDSLTINGVGYKMSKQSDTLTLRAPLLIDTLWIKPITTVNVRGNTTTYGFSHIEYFLDNNPNNEVWVPKYEYGTRGATGANLLLNSITLRSTLGGSNQVVLKARGATETTGGVDQYGLYYTANGFGGFLTINGKGDQSRINGEYLTVRNSGGVGIATDGGFYSANTSVGHQFGNLQIQNNSTPTSVGRGISTNNTASSFALYTTGQSAKDQFMLAFYTPASIPLAFTTQTNLVSIGTNMTLGTNTGGSNSTFGNGISLRYTIDQQQATTGHFVRDMMIDGRETTLTGTTHQGVVHLRGLNLFNVVNGSTGIGYDSTSTSLPRLFSVNGKGYFVDELNIGNSTDQGDYKAQITGNLYQNGLVNLRGVPTAVGTYTILTHQSASDSSITQIPSSTFATTTTIADSTGYFTTTGTTTNNTPTTLTVISMPSGQVLSVWADCVAIESSGDYGMVGTKNATFSKESSGGLNSGSPTVIIATGYTGSSGSPFTTADFTITNSGATGAAIVVTGETGRTIKWKVRYKIVKIDM